MNKLFCPLRSTSTTTIPCSSECMWYIENYDSPTKTCAIPAILMSQSSIISAVEDSKKDER